MAANRLLDYLRLIRLSARLIQVDDDRVDRTIAKLTHARNDVLLGIGIEIPIVERTGIHRIEELRNLAQV